MEQIHILLLDDEERPRRSVARYLKYEAGFAVAEFATGQEALADLEDNWQKYTAVALDFSLTPEMSGNEVLAALKKRYPRLPVIVFTGLDPAKAAQTLAKGAYHYMQRPINLVEMERVIHSLAEQDDAFFELAHDFRKLLHADACVAWRYEQREQRFRIAAWHSPKKVIPEKHRRTAFLHRDHESVRQFIQRATPIYVADVKQPKLAPNYRYRGFAKKQGWTSLISVPLVDQDQIIGILNCYSYEPLTWDEKERQFWFERVLPAFANRATEVFRNASLNSQLQALNSINTLLTGSHEESSILAQILSKALELVGSEMGWLYLVDANSAQLVLKEQQGIPRRSIQKSREIGEGITGLVAQKGQVVYVRDTTGDDQFQPTPNLQVLSEVGIPLRREEQTIGVLTVKSAAKDAFTSQHIDALMALTAQAAIVIERAKLTRHLEAVSQLALSGDNQKVADYVVMAASDLTGALANLWLLSPQKEENREVLRLLAGNAAAVFDRETTIPNDPAFSLTAVALQSGEPNTIHDITAETVEPTFYHLEEARREEWRSFMAMPLFGLDKRPLGALNLYSKQVGKFNEPDIELMRSFASQVAIAFENVRLLDEAKARQHGLEQLVESGQISLERISEESDILLEFVQQASNLTGADCTVIYPYDAEQREFFDASRITAAGLTEPQKEVAHRPRQAGLAAIIRHAGRIIIHDLDAGEIEVDLTAVPNSDLDEEDILLMVRKGKFIKRENVKAFVGVSLRVAEDGTAAGQQYEEAGVLYINYREPHKFDQAELHLIQIFAQQAANMIRASRLWQRLQQQLTLSQQQLAAMQALISSIGSEDRPLWFILEEITRLFGAEYGSIFRVDKQQLVAQAIYMQDEILYSEQIPPENLTLSLDSGITGYVARTGESVRVGDVSQDGRFLRWYPDGRSEMAVPIHNNGYIIGVLNLESARLNAFSATQEQLCQELAAIIAIAFEKASLLEQRLHDIAALQTINEAITAREAGIEDLVVAKAKELTQADYVSLWWCDNVNDLRISLRAAHGRTPQFDSIAKDSPSIISQVVRTGTPVLISDLREQTSYRRWYDDVQSSVTVPLRLGHRTVGALDAKSTQLNSFSKEKMELLKSLADQATIAIENAGLFAQIQTQYETQIEAITEIANSIVESQEQDILNGLLRWAISVLSEASLGEIHRYKEETGELVVLASQGELLEPTVSRFSTDEGVTGWVARHQQPLVVPDVEQEPRYMARFAGIQSEMAVPLMRKDKLVGVLNVEHPRKNAFSEQDVPLAEAIAGLAVVAMRNQELFQELRERAQRLTNLQTITASISAEVSRLDDILALIVEKVREIFIDADCIIRLFDSDRNEFLPKAVASQDAPPALVNYRPKKTGRSWNVLLSRKPYYRSYAQGRPAPKKSSAVDETMMSLDLQAIAVLPLVSDNESIGILYLSFNKPRLFSDNDKQILDLFATQAAVAIQKAKLREVQIQAIDEIATSISINAEQGETAVLERIIQSIVPLLGKSNLYTVRRLNPAQDQLEIIAARGELQIQQVHAIPVGEAGVGYAALWREPIIVPDTRQDERYSYQEGQARSELAVPLLKRDSLIGVLTVQNPQPNAFSDADLRLAEAIAALAVVAIDNAELYNRMSERVEQSTQARLELQAKYDRAETQLSIGLLIAEYTHRMNNLAGTIPGWTKLARKQLNPDDANDQKVLQFLHNIEEDTRKLQKAALEIKDTTKELAPERVDVNELMDLALDRVRVSQPAVERAVKVVRQFSEKLPTLSVERNLLLDALVSIMRNGVEAIPDEGTLTLKTEHISEDGELHLLISITDTGIGIDPEVLPRIFDIDYTTKEKGWGFGLWRDKFAINRLGGDISVESAIDEGSTFTIKIPIGNKVVIA